MEEMKYCQSCAMPLTKDEEYGTNANGNKSEDYCCYCFKNGAFVTDETMEQMIESCIPHVVSDTLTADQARAQMMAYFPKLKRWAK